MFVFVLCAVNLGFPRPAPKFCTNVVEQITMKMHVSLLSFVQVTLDPGWTLTDPDVPESHVWSAVSGGGGKFVVDSSSGFVHSTGNHNS